MDALPKTIEAPVEVLLNTNGVPIVKALAPDSYYGSFERFLADPEGARRPYAERLADGPLLSNTHFRAKAIHIAHSVGITFDEAAQLTELVDVRMNDEEAVRLVLDNYLSMRAVNAPHPVYGKIGQSGEIFVIEGVHRTLINRVAGFANMPVRVLERHSEWRDLHAFFQKEGRDLYGNSGATYHEIKHPDFRHYSVIREDRSGPILDYLRRHDIGEKGLDVGSMVGFYSHTLGCAGYQMTAIEYERKYADAFQRLADVYKSGATVRHGNVYDMEIEPNRYDFCLMLSLLYHLVRNDANRAQRLVADLASNIPLFFADTEPRTGILPESALKALFPGFAFELIHEGRDDRDIYAIRRRS